MKSLRDKSIDVVNAIEIFEHVEDPLKALWECHRVLRDEGVMLISAPFSIPYSRRTLVTFKGGLKNKWEKELNASGFNIEMFEDMGYFFSVMMDMVIYTYKANAFVDSLRI